MEHKVIYKVIGNSKGIFARTMFMDTFKTKKAAIKMLNHLKANNPYYDYEIIEYNNN